MFKSCAVLLAFGASSLFRAIARSTYYSMLQTASRTQTVFDVKGSAFGSNTRIVMAPQPTSFETQGAQPGFLPLSVRGPSMEVDINGSGANSKKLHSMVLAHLPREQI